MRERTTINSRLINRKPFFARLEESEEGLNRIKRYITPTIRRFEKSKGMDVGEIQTKITKKGKYTEVLVMAELGYGSMDALADLLDQQIIKLDPDAYFDHEDTGRIIAYIKD